ncbi:LD-carboxypeptidase [Desulfosarcina sp. OttesenSCG-928-A07]|nr:LD-carboxypeptidase [Desulfosarcina sp. OttesenSCG-928-A07]
MKFPASRIRPHALKPGDTLGIAAPAGSVDPTDLEAGMVVLQSMGFKLRVSDEIFAKSRYLAGTDLHRAGHLSRLFADPEIDGIICARGGYGAMRLLALLDSGMIAAHPKPFVGFSDITALLVFLTDKCGMATFHGPTVTTLGLGDTDTQKWFYRVLTEKKPFSLAASSPRTLVAGQAVGRFYCGNLTLFCHLTGTPFAPDLKDAVLLVEDIGEAPYRIDRMLTQMRLSGTLDRLAGLALGHFEGLDAENGISEIVMDRLGDLGFPICGGFGVGHAPDNATLPVGMTVKLDADAGTLVFPQPAVC